MSTLTSLMGTAPDQTAFPTTGFDPADFGEACKSVPAGTRRRELPCHTVDADLWFAESPADVEKAKALCAPCPLKQACLAGALERREPWGVWGGELVLSGVVVPRKRPRGRPRKDTIAA